MTALWWYFISCITSGNGKPKSIMEAPVSRFMTTRTNWISCNSVSGFGWIYLEILEGDRGGVKTQNRIQTCITSAWCLVWRQRMWTFSIKWLQRSMRFHFFKSEAHIVLLCIALKDKMWISSWFQNVQKVKSDSSITCL